jgi:hypothetical protein
VSRIRWITPEGDDVSTVLVPGGLPPAGTIHAEDWHGYDVDVDVELVSGRYRCRAVRVRQRGDGGEVTGEAIRTLSLSRVIGAGVKWVMKLEDMMWPSAPAPSEDDRKLKWVVETYRLAYAIGEAPKQAIAQGLGVSPATAGRWISRAREAGLLGPAEGPGKAGG